MYLSESTSGEKIVGVTSNDKNITGEVYRDIDLGSLTLKINLHSAVELHTLSKPKTFKLISLVAII